MRPQQPDLEGRSGFHRARVRSLCEPAELIRQLELVPEGGAPPYTPGSHVDVEVLIAGEHTTRSYSLVGESAPDGAYRIAVKQLADSRGGSRFMWSLAVGDDVFISSPKNHFELNHGAPEYLLLAGGIGVTPLLGMAQALARSGARLRFVYAARSRSQMAYIDELRACCGDGLSLVPDDTSSGLDLERLVAGLARGVEVYACGPLGLLRAIRTCWANADRPAASLRFETFGSSGLAPTTPFELEVRDHAKHLTVAGNQSVLEALRAEGIEVAGHCRRGECGLCVLRVLSVEGTLDHRDVFLSEAERRTCKALCACVSRATGRVVIDTGYRKAL